MALWCASIFKWVCGGKKHDRANKLEVFYFFFSFFKK